MRKGRTGDCEDRERLERCISIHLDSRLSHPGTKITKHPDPPLRADRLSVRIIAQHGTLTAIVYLRCGPCEPIPIEVGEEEMRGEKSLERCEEDGRGEIQRYVRDEGSDCCCYRAGFTRISVLERKRPVSRIVEGPGNAVESTSRRFRVLSIVWSLAILIKSPMILSSQSIGSKPRSASRIRYW